MRYVYWDSNCFIGFLQNEPEHADVLEAVIRHAEDGDLRIVTSAFTLTEVLKFKGADGIAHSPVGPEEKAHLEDCFSPENGIILVNVDRATATEAREVVWNRGIGPKDAVHVASAVLFKRSWKLGSSDTFEFHTFDKKLASHGDGIEGIPFVEPKIEDYPMQTSIVLQ